MDLSPTSCDLFGSDEAFDASLASFKMPEPPFTSVAPNSAPVTPSPHSGPAQTIRRTGKRRRVANVGPVNLGDVQVLEDPDELADEASEHDEEVDERYNDADQYEPIAFGEFGKYMANKRKKLKVQESALRERDKAAESRPQIFKGLSIHVNGYAEVPLSTLRRLIVLHGGTYMAYLDSRSTITHIIATSLTPKKRHEFRHYKVARPEWIIQSAEAGRLLRWSDFGLITDLSLGAGVQEVGKGELPVGTVVTRRNLFGMGVSQVSTPASLGRTPPRCPPTQEDVAKPGPSNTASIWKVRAAPSAPITLGISSTPSTLSDAPEGRPSTPKKRTAPTVDGTDLECPGYRPANPRSPHKSALLTDNAWLATHSAISPDFIHSYFKQSRLHHLSEWKAELLAQVGDLLLQHPRARQVREAKARRRLKGDEGDGRTVMHVDFDCFFTSAGLIKRPDLRGKPVAVCHSKSAGGGEAASSTSEIASCSYEARAFGVKNGMALGRARELCPQIATIPYDFDLYESISLQFYNILLSHADDLQAVSVDECFIDVSSQVAPASSPHVSVDDPKDSALCLAERIRKEICDATQCEASIGVSHNILLARLATRKAKPAGSFRLLPGQVSDYLATLDVDDLPRVGWQQRAKVEEALKTTNVGELRNLPLSKVQDALGENWGRTVYLYARGIDARELCSGQPRKSVSAEVNYGIRFMPAPEGLQQMETFTRALCQEVGRRLKKLGFRGRHLTLKVMKRAAGADAETWKFLGHGQCDEYSKVAKLTGPRDTATDDPEIIGEAAWKLLKGLEIPPEDLRGLAVQIQKLERTDAGTGQKLLPFLPKARKSLATGEVTTADDEDAVLNNSRGDQPQVQESSKGSSTGLPATTQFELPPVSQIDPDALAAMPPEVQAQFAAAKARTAKLPPPSPPRVPPPVPAHGPKKRGASIAAHFAPAKPRAVDRKSRKKVAQIDYGQQRLVPGTQAMMKCTTVRRAVVPPDPEKVTDAELIALGIDLDFFRGLKGLRDVQLDILSTGIQRFPDALTNLRKQQQSHDRLAAPRAGGADGGAARRRLFDIPAGPTIRKVSSTDDVCALIDRWLDACGHEAPDAGDMEMFSKFLLDSVDKQRGSGQDLEKVVDVVTWWEWGLRARAANEAAFCGDEWRQALEGVKESLNAVTIRDHGARIFVT